MTQPEAEFRQQLAEMVKAANFSTWSMVNGAGGQFYFAPAARQRFAEAIAELLLLAERGEVRTLARASERDGDFKKFLHGLTHAS